MFYFIAFTFILFVGFVAGILFERKNLNSVEKAIADAKELKQKGKKLLDALKGR